MLALMQKSVNIRVIIVSITDEVVAIYPKLRVLALSKTKNLSDAEDIVQDVMAKVWENPIKIEQAITQLGSSTEAYLKRAVINRFIDLRRYGKRFKDDEDFAEKLEESVVSDPTRRGLLLRDFLKHLTKIGDGCRELLIERGMGLKQAELAEARNLTQSAVNKQIAKCLKQLHERSGGIFHEA